MESRANGYRPSAIAEKTVMQDFRNIDVWHIAHQLTLEVYEATRRFPDDERYGLTSQLRRACASIPTNIAEGCVRKTDADFARFLYIAMGSASEVEYLLLLSHDQQYLASEDYHALAETVQQAKRMLAGFIRRLEAPAPTPSNIHRQPADSR